MGGKVPMGADIVVQSREKCRVWAVWFSSMARRPCRPVVEGRARSSRQPNFRASEWWMQHRGRCPAGLRRHCGVAGRGLSEATKNPAGM